MGQLVWDASQRRDHATAVGYYDQAIAAANQAGETTAEAYARLRKSYVALYGEQQARAGLRLAQQAAALVGNGASHALLGLALLHVGQGVRGQVLMSLLVRADVSVAGQARVTRGHHLRSRRA
jgi:hypothetical protein